MEKTHSQGVQSTTSKKNGEWEIILTDSSHSTFNFTGAMTNKYIMTDVISPLGQKLTLFNTIPSVNGEELVIGLNLKEIDQTKINSIRITSDKDFFTHWVVDLVDNRNDHSRSVSANEVLEVTPAIELNKLMSMGFTDNLTQKDKPLFELHLSKVQA